ncbi:hypothetical protein YPPY89_3809, partial [Yersinia pestis PY-89]
MVPSTIS